MIRNGCRDAYHPQVWRGIPGRRGLGCTQADAVSPGASTVLTAAAADPRRDKGIA